MPRQASDNRPEDADWKREHLDCIKAWRSFSANEDELWEECFEREVLGGCWGLLRPLWASQGL